MTVHLFGILNITEDSFSDGGRFLEPAAALQHARALIAGGADALDIGAASSNPEATGVAPEIEIARLQSVVPQLLKDGVAISIDTFSPDVQRWALNHGVAYINDIQGFPDPEIYPALAASDAKLIVMHSVQEQGRATRVEVSPEEIVPRCIAFFERRIAALTAAGIDRSRLILDPGMGFFLGSNPEASFTMLNELPQLKRAFGLPVPGMPREPRTAPTKDAHQATESCCTGIPAGLLATIRWASSNTIRTGRDESGHTRLSHASFRLSTVTLSPSRSLFPLRQGRPFTRTCPDSTA